MACVRRRWEEGCVGKHLQVSGRSCLPSALRKVEACSPAGVKVSRLGRMLWGLGASLCQGRAPQLLMLWAWGEGGSTVA